MILLEPQGRQFLSLIGKAVEPKGIIEAEHMTAAIAALQAAVKAQEQAQAQAVAQAKGRHCISVSLKVCAASNCTQ